MSKQIKDKKKPAVANAAGKSSKAGKETEKKGKGEALQVDYSQPVIVKNSKVKFGEKLEMVKEQHKDKLEDLIMEMDAVRKENERLRRQQEDTYGVSMDTVERMKKELERAKTTRMFLLEDIDIRKSKSEKLEAEIFEMNMKLESYMKKVSDYNKMKEEWIETSERLYKTEEKCEKLAKVNKNLRKLLIRHHIDPKAVDFDSGKSKRSIQSERTTAKPILKPAGIAKPKPAAHTLSHSYTHLSGAGKKFSRSLEDIRDVDEDAENVKRKLAMTSRRALGRGPASYLGYYTDIYQNRLNAKAKMDSHHLPKLVVA